jgi:hypothetical protein
MDYSTATYDSTATYVGADNCVEVVNCVVVDAPGIWNSGKRSRGADVSMDIGICTPALMGGENIRSDNS